MNVNPSLCRKEKRRPCIGDCWLTTTWPKVWQRSFGGIVHCKPQIDVLSSMERAHDIIPHSVASCHTKGVMTVSTTLTKIILTPRGVHLEDKLTSSIYNIRYGKYENYAKQQPQKSHHATENETHVTANLRRVFPTYYVLISQDRTRSNSSQPSTMYSLSVSSDFCLIYIF